MKKIILTLFASSMLTTPALAADYIMKFAHGNAPDETFPHHAAALMVKRCVEIGSSGQIEVEVYPMGQLGDGENIIPQVQVGAVSATYQATRAFTGFIPEVQVLEIPYMYSNQEAALQFLEGPISGYIGEKIEQSFPGVKLAGLALYGYRHLLSKNSINSYADIAGSKLRSIPSPLHEEFYKTLGATPIAIPWPEVYSALSTGLVESINQPFGDSLGMQFDDYLKYAYIDSNIFHTSVWLVSDVYLKSLPADLANVSLSCIDQARRTFKYGIVQGEYRFMQQFIDNGGTVVNVTEEDKAKAEEYKKVMVDWFVKKYEKSGQEAYDFADKAYNDAIQEVNTFHDKMMK
ncbi:MAG: TRAP transporter substrate-binding protein [Niabella sp.]